MKGMVKLEDIKNKENKNTKENLQKYSDIINMKHHVSNKHPQMSITDRAAQFAPYAALTGYGEEVKKCEENIQIDYEERNKDENFNNRR